MSRRYDWTTTDVTKVLSALLKAKVGLRNDVPREIWARRNSSKRGEERTDDIIVPGVLGVL